MKAAEDSFRVIIPVKAGIPVRQLTFRIFVVLFLFVFCSGYSATNAYIWNNNTGKSNNNNKNNTNRLVAVRD